MQVRIKIIYHDKTFVVDSIQLNISKNIIISFSDFSYQQLERTYCVKKGAPYDTLALAKKACDEDTTCQGVYDKSCDDQEGYYLCPKVDKSLSSASGSCVYEKIQDASGSLT